MWEERSFQALLEAEWTVNSRTTWYNTAMPTKQKLLIIDGNALIHRSFHAIPPLNNAKGEPVNAVFGFATTLLKAWKELKPTHIAATFDLRGLTFRHEEYKDYKATRVAAADELYAQIPTVKDMVRAFDIPIYELQGFEADDMIGTITKQAPKNVECIILTGDMDTMQLVDKKTFVYTLRKGMSDTALYTEDGVKERYGLRPDQVIDYKALRGDPSDNIPGVKGVGEKTATELLQTFGTLEKLYTELADETKKAKAIRESVREKLLMYRSDAFMSQSLATIKRDAPIEFKLDGAAIQTYDRDKVVALFKDLNFVSLVSKLPEIKVAPAAKQAAFDLAIAAPAPKKEGHHYTLVNDEKTWSDFLTKLRAQKSFAIDTETTGLDPWTSKLLGLSFSWKTGEGWYVVTTPERLQVLKTILEDPTVEKYGHNMKFDAQVFAMNDIHLAPVSFDSMLASYVLNPSTRQHSLDALAFTEFGYEMMPIIDLIGPKGKKQLTMESVPLEKLSWYAAEDADFTWRLVERLRPKVAKVDQGGVFSKIEMPLVPVLTDMELTGITIDVEFLAEMGKTMRANLKKIEKKIYDLAGKEFNINSPLQLKEILFDRLKISTDGIGRTKTGFSTAADELEKMKDAHPIIPLISQQREMAKLLSTYIEALPLMVNKTTGRVHTDYNQAIAATGRLSSNNPNLQNIPIRTDLGAAIRKAFVAGRGKRLISADYSQIELRIIASMARDTAMMESFKNNEDIHTRTAANINGVSLDKVTPQMRRAAKAVNFGIIYGLGYVGLSQGEGISRQEAKEFIEKYFAIHTNIRKWLDATKKLAHEQGYVETLFGRRRYFPEINSSNGMFVASAERQAINAPIQGTAADLMKLAMIKVYAELPTVSPKSKLLLQVHDEIIVETPVEEVEKVSQFVKSAMENVYALEVPIKVEVGVGKNWGEAK